MSDITQNYDTISSDDATENEEREELVTEDEHALIRPTKEEQPIAVDRSHIFEEIPEHFDDCVARRKAEVARSVLRRETAVSRHQVTRFRTGWRLVPLPTGPPNAPVFNSPLQLNACPATRSAVSSTALIGEPIATGNARHRNLSDVGVGVHRTNETRSTKSEQPLPITNQIYRDNVEKLYQHRADGEFNSGDKDDRGIDTKIDGGKESCEVHKDAIIELNSEDNNTKFL